MTARAAGPTIGIFYADTRNVGASDVEALVTDADRDRLAVLTRPSRRAQYLAGRALLRFALERWTGRPAALHPLTAQASGKLECVGGPPISVTHDGPLVACAISSAGDVGVDVQFPAPRRRTADIAREYFSAAESTWLRSAPAEAFYMLWVLKEAYLKSLGRGVAGGLSLLQCRIAPPSIEAAAAVRANLALYAVGDAHLGVATLGGRRADVEIECWSPSPSSSPGPTVAPPRIVATTA